jgi:hypothetical protein
MATCKGFAQRQYGKIAVDAVRRYHRKEFQKIEQCWDAAIRSAGAYPKSCPKNALVGLCNAGFVRGVRAEKEPKERELCIWVNALRALCIRDMIMAQDPPGWPDLSEAQVLQRCTRPGRKVPKKAPISVVCALFDKGLLL